LPVVKAEMEPRVALVEFAEALPAGMRSSCANAFFGQLKHIDDRDATMAHIARSERGYVDEEYKRYLSRVAAARRVVKLGDGQDEAELEPMRMRRLRVPALEPADGEILEGPRTLLYLPGRRTRQSPADRHPTMFNATFGFIEVLMLLGAGQGLLLAVGLVGKRSRNQAVDFLFAAVLLIVAYQLFVFAFMLSGSIIPHLLAVNNQDIVQQEAITTTCSV
jgi:hypothetical protein